MKLFKHVILGILLIAAIVFAANEANTYFSKDKSTKVDYASTNIPEYKESEINRLKRELDEQRLKSLRLQAKLDSCKYNITAASEITTPKVVFKRKPGKALSVCNEELMSVKTQLGECIGAKAQMEVEKDLQINLLKRQMDTCAYFVQEMDKALLKMSNDVTKLTNEKDSLTNVLETPIEYVSERPCFKTKRGAKIQAHAFPHKQTIIVNMAPFEKKEFKEAKKSCKSAK